MQTRNALTLLAVAAVAGGLAVAWTPPRQAHSVQADITAIPQVVANPLRIPTLEAEVFAAGVRTKDGKPAVQVVAIAPPEQAGAIIPLSMSWTQASFNQMSRVPMPAVISVSSAEMSLVIGPDGRAEAIVELAQQTVPSGRIQTPASAVGAALAVETAQQAATPNGGVGIARRDVAARIQLPGRNLPPNGVNVHAVEVTAARNGFTLSSPLAEAPVTLWAEPGLNGFLNGVPQVAVPATQPEQP